MKYSITFARNQDIDNIQHETVHADTAQQARDMFTVCDCYVYSCELVDDPDRDNAAILRAARTVSPAAVLTSGDLSRQAYGDWMAEAEADAQEFRDVKFGSKKWFDDAEEIPF